ncbi:MAG: sulfatase family protein [Jatrophihabitans sp.]|uniref:sulfatase family protein n=1 Tax=Jatrophihabitans sp. TaxID=1932789 RepID=UPI003F7D4D43
MLFVMTDQQRFDTIGALGNAHIRTPAMDRLVARGISYTNAYSCCPVCAPARYTIRTGCESPSTGLYDNGFYPDMHEVMRRVCGPYLGSVMTAAGYRTFGIGKFHTTPWDADVGFETQLHSEELYESAEQRFRDAYAGWIEREHAAFAHVEALMGERTEMYYVPQVSPLPAELTVESWAADRAVEQIGSDDPRPWFGFVSFVAPHPPFAPPVPWNRLYDPDDLPAPVVGDLAVDHADEQIPWMNYAVWADDISVGLARVLKARYYGEISYVDDCLGRILDVVERRGDAENTVICFFADHGDHLGDHRAWQKESFFEAATRVPFLVSWPARLPGGVRSEELVSLADLFGIATSAAGVADFREGVDLLGTHAGTVPPRAELIGVYGAPGTADFKAMVRHDRWKYIFIANGGREQLFDVRADPAELRQLASAHPDVTNDLRARAEAHVDRVGLTQALTGDRKLRRFEFRAKPRVRVRQFDSSRGVSDFTGRTPTAAVG